MVSTAFEVNRGYFHRMISHFLFIIFKSGFDFDFLNNQIITWWQGG